MAKGVSYSTGGDGELALNNFVEISIDPVLLNNFSTEDGLNSYFNSYASTEEFKELRAELFNEVMDIIQNQLTDKQKQVVIMTYIDGKTQNEISIELGRHQTAIHKTLKGNIDYGNNGKRYGGALKKIRKLCADNENIQRILGKMREGYVATE